MAQRDTWLVASQNVELVQSILAAWERGDWSSVEGRSGVPVRSREISCRHAVATV